MVTACHVADGFRSKDGVDHPGIKQIIQKLKETGISSEIQIGISFQNIERDRLTFAAGTDYISAALVAIDPAHDLALLKSAPNPFTTNLPMVMPGASTKPKAVKFSATRPRDGEEIFACGYPFGQDGLITTSGIVASAWSSRVPLRAEAAGFIYPLEIYTLNLNTNPGNSGGPVFRTADDSVVGVTIEAIGSLGTAIPAKLVSGFLEAQKLHRVSAIAPQQKFR